MQTLWDLLPASIWPTQSFIPPDEAARVLQMLHSLQTSGNSSSPTTIGANNRGGGPWTRLPSAMGFPSGGEDVSTAPADAGPSSFTNPATTEPAGRGGILGATFGEAVDPSPAAAAPTAPMAQQPSALTDVPGLGAGLGAQPWRPFPIEDPAPWAPMLAPSKTNDGVFPKQSLPAPAPPAIFGHRVLNPSLMDQPWGGTPAVTPHWAEKMFGLNGVERYQFFPERAVRGLADSLERVMTQDPWDPATGTFRPEAIEAATDLALATMTPGTAFRVAPAGSIGMGARSARPPAPPARPATRKVDAQEAVSPSPVVRTLIGQVHHAISRKIHNALEKHPNLAGLYRHRDPRFETRAVDLKAHNGYDEWHRAYDAEVSSHIHNHPELTPETFEKYLRERFAEPDLMARFPEGL